MDGVGALRGASLCRRINRKRWGANGWLKVRTKRGAGTVRRARIQILSGKMFPLSEGYIAGRANSPDAELATQELPVGPRCRSKGPDLETSPWPPPDVFGFLCFFSPR